MNRPVAGGRLSFGTSVNGTGRDRRYLLSSRRVLSAAPTTTTPAVQRASRVPDRSNRCPPTCTWPPNAESERLCSACASAEKLASEMNRTLRDSVLSDANVRPPNSSTTFSCSSVYPLTHVSPQKAPSHTANTAAHDRLGIAASTNSGPAAASND